MSSLKGYFYLFCAFTLAGTSVVSARLVSGSLGTFTITTASLCFALFLLLPLCYKALIKAVRSMSLSNWLLTGVQSLFGIFLFRLFLLQGLLHTSTSEAGILTGATPAVTAILAYAVLKERVSLKKLSGIACTIAGILFIQGLAVSGNVFSSEHFWGNVLVLCAAASESLYNILSRITAVKTAKKAPLNPVVQTALVSIIALLLCLIPSCFENPIGSLALLDITQWVALIWYGLFVTALAFIFWYSGIKRCSANTAAAFSGMMPFSSLLLSVTLLGEHTELTQWLGGGLIILGMILIGLKARPSASQAIAKET